MKVCGHPEDAEDTMQEVLSRSIGHLAKIQTPQQMAVWLYTVTRNRCWRMRRKPAHAPAHLLSLDELMPDGDELGRLLEDAAADPESNVLAAEQHHLLHQAILRIPATLRIVLVLHDMEELTTDQVAQVLSLQQGTVRIRLHRARLSVRKEMSQLLNAIPELPKQARRSASKPRRARANRARRPAECRDLFANLSEYLDGRVEPLHLRTDARTHRSMPVLRGVSARSAHCHRSLPLPGDPLRFGLRTASARHPHQGIPAHVGDPRRQKCSRHDVTNCRSRGFLLMEENAAMEVKITRIVVDTRSG